MRKQIPTALWVTGLVCGCLGLAIAVITTPVLQQGRKYARQRVKKVDDALAGYLSVEKRCPRTPDELIAGGYLTRRDLDDPWGRHILYSCSGKNWEVRSSGPDKILNTPDDIATDPADRERSR